MGLRTRSGARFLPKAGIARSSSRRRTPGRSLKPAASRAGPKKPKRPRPDGSFKVAPSNAARPTGKAAVKIGDGGTVRTTYREGGSRKLVSAHYERASVIVTSNKAFGRSVEVFDDATTAAAMIDLLVHHADVVSLKGDSYRLNDRDLGRVASDDTA